MLRQSWSIAPLLVEIAPSLPDRANILNDQIRSRVRDHFTTVQLTLLSIIVALVLENLLSAFWERGRSDGADLTTVLWWLQAILILLSSISTWAGFGLSLSLNSRRVNFVDVIAPFALLITLNLAVGMLYPGNVSAYLLTVGGASGIAGIMLLSDVWSFATEAGAEREVSIAGPATAMKLQLGIAGWNFAGAALIWLGVLDLRGGCFIIAMACIGQGLGLTGTIRGWRSAT